MNVEILLPAIYVGSPWMLLTSNRNDTRLEGQEIGIAASVVGPSSTPRTLHRWRADLFT